MTHRSGPRRRDERGAATMLAIGWIVVVSTMGSIAILAATVAAAQHHLDGAADLAAVSAAQAAQTGSDAACDAAAWVAQANGVAVDNCRRDGVDVVVTLVDTLGLPWGLAGTITASARAGP